MSFSADGVRELGVFSEDDARGAGVLAGERSFVVMRRTLGLFRGLGGRRGRGEGFKLGFMHFIDFSKLSKEVTLYFEGLRAICASCTVKRKAGS